MISVGDLVKVRPHQNGEPRPPTPKQRSHGVIGENTIQGFLVNKEPNPHLRWVSWETVMIVLEVRTFAMYGGFYRCLLPDRRELWFKESWITTP